MSHAQLRNDADYELHNGLSISNKDVFIQNKLHLIFKGIGLFITDGYFMKLYKNFLTKNKYILPV